MSRTAASVRTDPATRLAEFQRQRPEWQTWLALLGEAERALADPAWRDLLNVEELEAVTAAASGHAPLLHGQTLKVDADRVQALVRRLAASASQGGDARLAQLGSYRPPSAQAVRLAAAAARQDAAEIGALAAGAGIDRGVLISIAHLAAFPLLQSCGRVLQDRIPRSWAYGYCPICGAWPILAERRGLDQTRRLRCGRCAAEWQVQWFCCTYCDQREHEQLGSLVIEERGERLHVETCSSCRGYVKSFATLQQIPSFELLLQDLETVELDLAALDRGYARPEEPGFILDVRLV
jgi:FdhE protein